MQKAIDIFTRRRALQERNHAKRLRNGTYSLAEQTELGMIFLFYFLRHQYKPIKKSEIDLNSPHALAFHVLCRLMSSFNDWEF